MTLKTDTKAQTPLHLRASEFYTLHRPSKCELRVHLRERGEPEAEPGPFGELLLKLGVEHERRHLASLGEYVDVSGGEREEREERTRSAIEAGAPVIYQAAFSAAKQVGGAECEIVGDPDYLIRIDGGYAIRDSKLSRNITEEAHPEVLRQVELYGWLYEQVVGERPRALEAHSGSGEIVRIAYDGGKAAFATLEEMVAAKLADEMPYTPVGWSKCSGCGFYGGCWPKAQTARDVSLVMGVDQGLARTLHERGVETFDALVSGFTDAELEDLERPVKTKMRRVGRKAGAVLRMARALAEDREIVVQAPAIPVHEQYVMFDLEGLPAQFDEFGKDELEKIYLWGTQVFGAQRGEFRAALAGFGEDGDREGWQRFLAGAQEIFDQHGDIRFVHWGSYEKTKLRMYAERFGDRDGIAARVERNLLDLHPITRESIALPVPSYGLKVIEDYVGYERKLEGAGGDWAMAMYIEATETEDLSRRDELVEEICAYNREDLEATWAVLEWLRGKAG